MPEEKQPTQPQAPIINLDISGSQNQINAGNNTNISQTINNFANSNDDLIEKLIAAIQQAAAVSDLDLDADQVDQLGVAMQAVYDEKDPPADKVQGVVDRFKEFVSGYSERLLPMIAKSTLGLLSTAATATGHPLVAMLLTVMQDAIEGHS